MFTTYETLFLMAVDDAEGDLLESSIENLEPALAGAVLVELVLCGRITLENDRVAVVNSTQAGNPILDHALDNIINTTSVTRSRKVKYWINALTYASLRSDIGQYLVEKGVLTRQKKHLLLVVPYEGEVSAKYALKNRLREVVLAGAFAGQAEAIQLALLYYSDLLTLVFTPGERKAAARKAQALITEEGGLTRDKTILQIISVATRSIN